MKRPWKPVLHNEEFPVTEDEEKHPSIIKNGKDMNVSNLEREGYLESKNF